MPHKVEISIFGNDNVASLSSLEVEGGDVSVVGRERLR